MNLYRVTIAKNPDDLNPLATDDKVRIRAVNQEWAVKKLTQLGYATDRIKKIEQK